MKKVLLTTTAIVGLTAPAFAADPTAVSDQPYFHHSHPMTWSGAMSIKLTNQSTNDSTTAVEKAKKRDFVFEILAGNDDTIAQAAGAFEETRVGSVTHREQNGGHAGNTVNNTNAIQILNCIK